MSRFRWILPLVVLALLLVVPWGLYQLRPRRSLDLVLLDKTVPFPTRVEHRSLYWLLDFLKIDRADPGDEPDIGALDPRPAVAETLPQHRCQVRGRWHRGGRPHDTIQAATCARETSGPAGFATLPTSTPSSSTTTSRATCRPRWRGSSPSTLCSKPSRTEASAAFCASRRATI